MPVNMSRAAPRIAYVVKRYPRFSETFIVNEILAHEAAGTAVEIFSLYAPNDTHFQDALARVRAPVTYLTADGLRAVDFWQMLTATGAQLPQLWPQLREGSTDDAKTVGQAAWLARLVAERQITHLHAHFATAAASVARLASVFAGVPYTVTAHAKDIFHESVTPHALRATLSGAARVVTVSDFNRRFLTGEIGLSPHQVQRIYNGLDLERFRYVEPAGRRPEIVAVGRLVEKKGFDDLLQACAILRARGMALSCRIIGSGPEEAALKARSAALSLTHTVHFDGALPQSMVVERLVRAAVFAAPCVVAGDGDRDGLPTVLLESMALGTPVVSTDVVGIPEIVRDGDTGHLIPQRDPSALADALAQCLMSASHRVEIARRARLLIERDFDVRQCAAQLRRLFGDAERTTLARAS